MIEYSLDQANPSSTVKIEGGSKYWLMTTLPDPVSAPAQELAKLYSSRWQVEAVFDKLKSHLRDSRHTLRSKTPELVRQVFYGWVMAHYAVCWLMHQVATTNAKAYEKLSFRGHVQLFKRE